MLAAEETALKEETARLRMELDRLHGELVQARAELEAHERASSQESAQTHEVHDSYAATVRALSKAVEARDAYTGKHAERVTAYGLAIAQALGIPEAALAELEFGFLLHDIGKVAIADAILYKPDALDDRERALMHRHPQIGAEIVSGIEFLHEAAAVIRSHHERWDGQGYPEGLAGEEIPLAARVFSIADVLDALTTDRPYRPASSLARARSAISVEAGRQFDPRVVAAFKSIPDETLNRIRAEIG